MKKLIAPILSCVALHSFSASAAPTPSSQPLSSILDGDDLKEVERNLPEGVEMKTFIGELSNIFVFPDHMVPTEKAKFKDKNLDKLFYAAPYFAASSKREVLGSDEINQYGLKVLESVDELADGLFVRASEIARLSRTIDSKQQMVALIEKKLTVAGINQTEIDRLNGLKAGYQSDITAARKSLDELRKAAADGVGGLSQSVRKEIAQSVAFQVSKLGITLTADEEAKLSSSNADDVVTILISIRAKASRGQFAVRQATFDAGLNDEQQKMMSVFQKIRPDIKIKSLPITAIRAMPTAQTQFTIKNDLFGSTSLDVQNAAVMYRGINLGSGGKCGGTKTCTVTVEYTAQGAIMALASRLGAPIIPVTFEGDTQVAEPNFDGKVTCDFSTGWFAKGRSDVKDGAIIYDGDVYNRIKYESFSDGEGCKFDIKEGSADSAAYHTLWSLYSDFLTLQYDRTLQAKADKDAYMQKVTAEVDYHAKRSQNRPADSSPWSNIGTWTSAFGGPWGTVAGFAVSEARNFYWHTRIEDTSSTDRVKFNTAITIKNVTRQKTFTFSGDPVVCYKMAAQGGATYISACGDMMKAKKDSELGTGNNNCPADTVSSCGAATEEGTPDDDGDLSGAFG